MSALADPKPAKRYRAGYRVCPDCGGWMANHAYRCRKCSPLIRGENAAAWKGTEASVATKRERARALYAMPGTCERCDAPARDRHHIDGDTGNNAQTNLSFLCRRCHMEVDGRLGNLRKRNQTKPSCITCSRVYRRSLGFRHGECWACRSYWLRNGHKRVVDVDGNLVRAPKFCEECGQQAKPLRRGLCHACNERQRRRLAKEARLAS